MNDGGKRKVEVSDSHSSEHPILINQSGQLAQGGGHVSGSDLSTIMFSVLHRKVMRSGVIFQDIQ